MVAGGLLYFYFDPSVAGFFPPCPFLHLTGFFCPGCGSQRALHHLLHGELIRSADHNLLFVAFLPLVGYSAFTAGYRILGNKTIPQLIFDSAWLAKIVLVLVLAFWALRNIPVLPFTWLAP